MVDNSAVSPRLMYRDAAGRVPAMLAVAVLWLALASGPASAQTMQVGEIYGEPDVRELAASVSLLLRDQVREIRSAGRVAGVLGQLGSTMTATVVVYGEGDAIRGQVSASAPYGRVDVLAQELGRGIAEAMSAEAPKAMAASFGELWAFVAAEAALARGEPQAAALALRAASADVAAQAPAVKAVAAKLATDSSVPLEDQVHAALLGRDYTRVRALAEERLARSPETIREADRAVAHAAMARYHLALFNSQAAGAALAPIGSDSDQPSVLLAAALMAGEDERGDLLLPLLTGKALYVPAAVALAGLPPKALGSKQVRAALAAARSLAGSQPALATALALAAARAKASNDALELIEVVWLRPADLAIVEKLVADAVEKRWPAGLRLRAELKMRAGDTKGALEDARAALAQRPEPEDARLRRYVAWLLADAGDFAEAAKTWRAVEATLGGRDRLHLARLLAAGGEAAGADAIRRALGDQTSIESQVAVSHELIRLGKPAEAVVLLERLSAAAPASAVLLTALAAAYEAAERPEDKVAVERLLAALAKPGEAAEAPVLVERSVVAPADDAAVSVETVVPAAELVAAIRPVVVEALRPLTEAGVTALPVLLPPERSPRLYWPHVEHPERLTAAVNAVLKELGVVPQSIAGSGPGVSDCRGDRQALAAIAQAHELDLVLAYTLQSRFGGQVEIAVCLYHSGVIELARPTAPLAGRRLGLLSSHAGFYYGLGGAGAVVLLTVLGFLLLPRGTLVVTLKPDSDAKNETYELLVSRSPEPPALADPEAFTRRLSAAGYTKSRRRASMVSVRTEFPRLPAGTWYVHITGTYQKGNVLRVYSGERTHRVEIRPGKRAEVTFQLAADAAEYHLTVADTHGPLHKAVVWVDSHRDKRATTDKEGKLVLDVPLGEHIIHVEAKGDVLHKPIMVSNTEVSHLSIHFDRERRLAGGIAIDGISDSGMSDRSTSESGLSQRRIPARSVIVDPTAKTEASLAGGALPASAAGKAAAGLDRYQLGQELGRGAMGVVYRAHDRVLERDVAVKIMRDEIRHHEVAWQLFVQEAKTLAALNHPNIVAVYDKGQDAEQPFIVMELVEGTTIEVLLAQKERLELGQALAFIDQLCAGLAYAHSRRVVHRDIKPGNMFLTGDGVIKITDFGLARILDELRIRQTEVRGTPAYMAPEQVLGTDIDFRADLYAVGCTLYEMVTGRPPFVSGELFYHHVHTPPERPSAVAAGIPPALDRLILACLQKQKEQRIRSAEAIRQAIAAIAAELGEGGAARLAMQRTKLYGG